MKRRMLWSCAKFPGGRQPKDYDPTLARIAGNIAAGIVGRSNGPDPRTEEGKREIVSIAVVLAKDIIRLCRAQNAAPEPPDETQERT